ncbi:MAG TPA: hypothetical protein VNK43_10110 [Gemmatimonadales bacterium]|nr:hypothetical protein [Gemmatimonadales bacterium]
MLHRSRVVAGSGAALILAAALGFAPRPADRPDPAAPDREGMVVGRAALRSAGELAFAPEGTLFVADSRAGMLHALDVQDAAAPADSGWLHVPELDARVAAALGTTRDRLRFNDMATHPRSRNIYLSVSRGVGDDAVPVIARVDARGEVSVLDLERIRHASTPIPSLPGRDETTPWGQPKATLTVTDIAYVDGEVYLAGLSNEQFSSALRRVPFPFTKPAALTTLEIYHTSHDRYETEAPITAFVAVTLGGAPMIVAGYGCSPIATFRRSDLASQRHLRGRTVAELGGGNRPVDMIAFERDGKRRILIANNARTLALFDAEALASAPELTRPVSRSFQPAGLPYLPVASAGVMHLDDFGPEAVLVLRRDLETGAVELVTYSKRWL